MTPFLRAVEKEPLVCFGAVATMVQNRGFDLTGCLGKWFIDHPDDLRWLTRQYVNAGCQIMGAGGSQCGPWKLEKWGLEDQIMAINRGVTETIRSEMPAGSYITGTILPTGKLLAPMGDLDPDALYEAYREEAAGYAEGSADAIWVMTMMDIEEAVIAVNAVKDATPLPVIASMAFDMTPRGPHTMMGVDPETAASRLVAAGADIVGLNCGGVTPEEATPVLEEMRKVTDKPLVSKPNAGKPEVIGNLTQWQASPEQFAASAADWVAAGARIVGGCCGSTPAHAAMIKAAVSDRPG